MATSQTTLGAEQRADARFYEQIAAHARQYLAFLDARLALLTIQTARGAAAFERADARDEDERAAQTTLASLPPASRALFEAVVEQERQTVQSEQTTRGLDPDEATLQALRRLRDEAQGIGTEGGKGLIPRGTPDEVKWYAIDLTALHAAPTAATYAATAGDPRTRRRMMLQAGVALGVLMLALIWLLIPRAKVLSTANIRVATANGAPLAAWPIHALAVTNSAGDTLTLPVSPTASLGWPAANPQQLAYWHTNSVWPLRVCLPPALLTSAAQVRLVSDGAHPDRVYTLASASEAATDLILAPCSAADTGLRRASLSATSALPALALGTSARLPIGPVTPIAVAIAGPGDDPALPPDQARVSVRVRAPQDVDWPTLAPALLLPSGAAVLPSDTRALTGESELRYLVPLPTTPLALLWQLTPSQDAPAVRWHATLEPPPSRAAVLRANLGREPPHVTPGDTPGTIVVTFAVVNRGAAPLQLSGSDITLAAANQPPITPDPAALRQPLAPGERRTIALNAPLGPRATLTLTIGVARYAIALEEGG
jgi:hypothetical protein